MDIGIGTGLLSHELYKKGAKVYGIDFSKEMIRLAQQKIPEGKFFCHDFQHGLPVELKHEKFDYIISSYAIHHLKDEDKIEFINELKKILKGNGKIILADVSFPTRKDMELCKSAAINEWDDEGLIKRIKDIPQS